MIGETNIIKHATIEDYFKVTLVFIIERPVWMSSGAGKNNFLVTELILYSTHSLT